MKQNFSWLQCTSLWRINPCTPCESEFHDLNSNSVSQHFKHSRLIVDPLLVAPVIHFGVACQTWKYLRLGIHQAEKRGLNWKSRHQNPRTRSPCQVKKPRQPQLAPRMYQQLIHQIRKGRRTNKRLFLWWIHHSCNAPWRDEFPLNISERNYFRNLLQVAPHRKLLYKLVIVEQIILFFHGFFPGEWSYCLVQRQCTFTSFADLIQE